MIAYCGVSKTDKCSLGVSATKITRRIAEAHSSRPKENHTLQAGPAKKPSISETMVTGQLIQDIELSHAEQIIIISKSMRSCTGQ